MAKQYSCINNACVEKAGGRYSEPTCGGNCSSSNVKKYACVDNACVEKAGGRYSEPTCGGNCSAAQTTKYKCENGVCKAGTSSDYTFATIADCQASGCRAQSVRRVGSRYQDCTGKKIRFKGCKDTDGIIHRVQGCIGAKQDSKFWTETETQLKLKTGEEYFTTDQVDAICSGKLTPGGEEEGFDKGSAPGTKEYWYNLIASKQVSKGGFLTRSRQGYYVYLLKIDKIDRENPPAELDMKSLKKYPITSMREVKSEIEDYDFVVFYPIGKNSTEGKFSFLKLTTDVNGEEEIGIDASLIGSWELEPRGEVFSFTEKDEFSPLQERVSKAIRKALEEQKIRFDKSGTPGGQQGGGGQQGQDQQGGGSNVSMKPNPNDVKDVVDPIRLDTIKILKDIQDDTAFTIGAKPEDKKTMQDAINLLQNFDSSKACDQIDILDSNISQLETLINQNKNKFGAGEIVGKATRVKNNLVKVKSECQRLQNEVQQKQDQGSKQQGDQGSKQQGDQGSKQQGDEGQQGQQGQGQQMIKGVQIEDKGYDRNTCRDKIKNLHLAAFPPSLGRDKSNITVDELPEIKKDILYCVTEFPFLSGMVGVKDEIKELLDCRTTKTLRKRAEGDTSEYRRKFCLVSPNYNPEEIKHIKKELRVESTLKDNVGSLITEAVISKRKEKTRDIITEDLLKMIKR